MMKSSCLFVLHKGLDSLEDTEGYCGVLTPLTWWRTGGDDLCAAASWNTAPPLSKAVPHLQPITTEDGHGLHCRERRAGMGGLVKNFYDAARHTDVDCCAAGSSPNAPPLLQFKWPFSFSLAIFLSISDPCLCTTLDALPDTKPFTTLRISSDGNAFPLPTSTCSALSAATWTLSDPGCPSATPNRAWHPPDSINKALFPGEEHATPSSTLDPFSCMAVSADHTLMDVITAARPKALVIWSQISLSPSWQKDTKASRPATSNPLHSIQSIMRAVTVLIFCEVGAEGSFTAFVRKLHASCSVKSRPKSPSCPPPPSSPEKGAA
mmetsp:Transcript_279/g.632  ORF Transcript_279/g.632 Transcript_279/m.632 type:complete len:322 (-) Transcript_279:638-1603(-)